MALISLREILDYDVVQAPVPFRVWEVIYVLVLIQVLAVILDRLLFRPIMGVLDERKRRLDQASAARERALASLEEKTKQHADRLMQARREALKQIDAARQEAEAARKGQLDEARGTAEGQIAMAREAVAKAARKAEHELRMSAMQLGRQIAQAVLGREVAP